MINRHNTFVRTGLSLAAMACSSAAFSESFVLEEIIITAQKRAESLQDVPISVTALDGTKIKNTGIDRIEDLSAYTPNFKMSQAPIGNFIYMRGIGSGVNQGFEQAVAVFSDGIHNGRSQQSKFSFLDLERVEVLRGPQSVLFGKNTIGGAIGLISAKPTEEFEMEINALYEPRDDEKELIITVSGPISDTLKGRLAVRKYDMDGYFTNTTLDAKEPEREEIAVRGTLQWNATEKLTVTVKAEEGEFDDKGRIVQLINGPTFGEDEISLDRKKQENVEYRLDNDAFNFTATVTYDLDSGHTLTSVSGYASYEFEEKQDGDFRSGPTRVIIFTDEEYSQFSQELRITSPGDQTIDYIAGLFYQTSDLDFIDFWDVFPANSTVSREFGIDSDSLSAFGQLTWNISDSVSLTGGLRWTRDDKDGYRSMGWSALGTRVIGEYLPAPFQAGLGAALKTQSHFEGFTQGPLDNSRSETSVTPLIAVKWEYNNSTMLYVSATTGFKGGSFDARGNVLNSWEFEEEEARSFEMGAKMGLFDGTAELNLAVFHTDFENMQVSSFDGGIGFLTENIGEATTRGVEFDGRWQLSESLLFTASLAYLDFELTEFPAGQCYFGRIPDSAIDPGKCDFTGKEGVFSPEWSGSVTAQYTTPITEALNFNIIVDVNFLDNHYTITDLDPRSEQPVYTKFNVRAAVSGADDTWQVALVGKNLTDKSTFNFANDTPVVPGGFYAYSERPRSLALEARYRF